MSLSLGVLVVNSAAYIEKLLRVARDFADEVIVGVDSSSTDQTEQICQNYADKVFLLEPIGTSERALAWLNEQCTSDWILRLDHDELPSTGLVQSLPRLTKDREYTHYWLPRRWVIGRDETKWISQHPWWPDWQLRLFRNVRSIVSFPGHLHSDYTVQGAGGYFSEASIYHYDLVYHSEGRRRRKLEQYEAISPNNSMPFLYLPNEMAVAQRQIPEEDAPWRGTDFHNPARKIKKPISASPYVSRLELRTAERKECHYVPELFRATLKVLFCADEMIVGRTSPVELHLRNDSSTVWPGPRLGVPEIRLGYHWSLASGEIYDNEGFRTNLPLTLRPGESSKVIAEVVPPWEPGEYILSWDPMIENVSWFSTQGWKGPNIRVRVNLPTGQSEELAKLGPFFKTSQHIPGWIRGEEAEAVVTVSRSLPNAAIVVEIGSFLGSGTILLAGARKVAGSGKVHCVDPFDCSGDAFSVPTYQELFAATGGGSLRQRFEENLRTAGLMDWVEVHQGVAVEIAKNWTLPVDLLFLDGDHSRIGASAAYESWSPFLKRGSIVAVHNSKDRVYAADHDGNRLVAVEKIIPPSYTDIRLVGTTTFGRKV